MGTSSPQGPLARIDTWAAPWAAAAAVDPQGRTHRHGDTSRVTRVASITKLCTALAVLLAVEEGTVGLGDPLGPPGSTVRHLLCHAGGLDFDTPSVITAPGTRRIYSNTGYELLADHVAERTGLGFGDYLAEGVLSPFAMGSSELRGSAAKDLHSNVEDLLALVAQLREPTVLHPSSMEEFRMAQFPDLAGVLPGWGSQDPCPWGLGPELRGTKTPHWTGSTAAPTTYGHFGGSGTLLWIDPAEDVACVVLTEREFGDWALEAWPPFSDSVRAAYS